MVFTKDFGWSAAQVADAATTLLDGRGVAGSARGGLHERVDQSGDLAIALARRVLVAERRGVGSMAEAAHELRGARAGGGGGVRGVAEIMEAKLKREINISASRAPVIVGRELAKGAAFLAGEDSGPECALTDPGSGENGPAPYRQYPVGPHISATRPVLPTCAPSAQLRPGVVNGQIANEVRSGMRTDRSRGGRRR